MSGQSGCEILFEIRVLSCEAIHTGGPVDVLNVVWRSWLLPMRTTYLCLNLPERAPSSCVSLCHVDVMVTSELMC